MISQRFPFVNRFLKVFLSFLYFGQSRLILRLCPFVLSVTPSYSQPEDYFTTTFIILPGTTISLITVFPSIAALIFSSA